MTHGTFIDKVLLRLNKLYSQDYNDIDLYKLEEAANKAVDDVVRRLIKGNNQKREGDEETSSRIDDIAVLLKSKPLVIKDNGIFTEGKIPDDYRYYKRLTPIVSKESCKDIRIKSSFLEEANVDDFLIDYSSQPSFDFEETFHTQVGKVFRIYHNNDFNIDEVILLYYRNPKYLGLESEDKTTVWEFKEDLCEVFVDEAVKIIAGDTENVIQHQLADKRINQNI